MDVSGRILANLDAGHHAGMTKLCIFMFGRQAQARESLRDEEVFRRMSNVDFFPISCSQI